MKKLLAGMLPLLLAGCFESPSDLLGEHANIIERTDPIFSLKGQIYYLEGVGKSVAVCSLKNKADMRKSCNQIARLSLERTSRGNYIVQVLQTGRNFYGLWLRSDESPAGKSGFQCFAWLGDGIVGSIDMSGVALDWGSTRGFTKLAGEVRNIATEEPINRQQLLKIAEVFENNLAPIGSDKVTCVGDRVWLSPTGMQITGDNRHLRQFEPGTSAPR
jgi:hypothetical protein